jgi:hypothetical protein
MIASSLPPLYAAWIDELLEKKPVPDETEATCDDCVLCPREGVPTPFGADHLNPDTKCCTYTPDLPSYLVGRILATKEGDAAFQHGRAALEKRIASGAGVTPLGVACPPVTHLLYLEGREASFGQSPELMCPHYVRDGGKCGVWQNRNARCATYFCKHVRGQVGLDFWSAVHRLLFRIEKDLAAWCLGQLDVGTDALELLFPVAGKDGKRPLDRHDLAGEADPARLRRVWGAWAGRERAFYEECARLVSPLRWADVQARCGGQVPVLARLVRDHHARLLSTKIPDVLRPAPVTVVPHGHDTLQVGSYRSFDHLLVPKAVIEALHHFDGRPTREVLRSIADDEGLELDDTLVLKLVDFGILTAG